MPKLKIIYVVGYNLIENTGRTKATREKAEALKEITGKDNFKLYAPGFSKSKLVRYFYMLFFDIYMLGKFLFLKNETIVIQRQTFFPLSNTYLFLRKFRIVYEVHADLHEEVSLLEKSNPEKIVLYFLAWAEKYNLRLASGIIYNHPSRQASMQMRYAKPSIYFYSGANSSGYSVNDTIACRNKLHLPESSGYFLFAGMISKWHGVDLLIEIFKQEIMKNYILLLVGWVKNDYSIGMKENAKEYNNIIFIEHTDILTAGEYINASDICLLPVKQVRSSPGSPLKLYDYISFGKPVVAQKDVLGYSDEVLDYNLGIVTDFNDTGAAARDLVDFFNSANRDFYFANNTSCAMLQLSWHSRMQKWIDFLKTL